MCPAAHPIVDRLTHAETLVFEQGLAELGGTAQGDDVRADLVLEFCGRVAESAALGAVKRERRTTLVLRHAPTSDRFLRALAAAAVDWTPEVRNSVARFVPAHISRSHTAGRLDAGRTNPPPTSPVRPAVASMAVPVDEVSGGNSPAVLLLGTCTEQERNLRGTRTRGISAVAGRFPASLPQSLPTQTCAESWSVAVFGRSCRSTSTPHSFKKEALWPPEFCMAQARHARVHPRRPTCRQMPRRSVPGCDGVGAVAWRELSDSRDGHSIAPPGICSVCNPREIRFCPADIDSSQSQLLIASVAEHVRARHVLDPVCLNEIRTVTVPGGQSAFIIRAEPDDGGRPLIAKLAPIDQLRGEMERFERFIRPWDELLQPRFHFHATSGVIVFGLVAASNEPDQTRTDAGGHGSECHIDGERVAQ